MKFGTPTLIFRPFSNSAPRFPASSDSIETSFFNRLQKADCVLIIRRPHDQQARTEIHDGQLKIGAVDLLLARLHPSSYKRLLTARNYHNSQKSRCLLALLMNILTWAITQALERKLSEDRRHSRQNRRLCSGIHKARKKEMPEQPKNQLEWLRGDETKCTLFFFAIISKEQGPSATGSPTTSGPSISGQSQSLRT